MFDDLSKKNNLPENNVEEGKEKLEQNKNQFNHSMEQPVKSNENQMMPENKEKIEDIFSETDKPSPLKELDRDNNSLDSEKQGVDRKRDKLIKILILVGFIVGLVVILGVSYWLIGKLFDNSKQEVITNTSGLNSDNKKQEESIDNNIDNSKKDEKIIPIENNDITEKPIEVENIVKDSDKDGLSDVEEEKLGLDINNVDSDNDGLFDREEVMVYLTNPLDSDTDKDGYLDGAEVRDGYNPNGTGKLYDVNNNIE